MNRLSPLATLLCLVIPYLASQESIAEENSDAPDPSLVAVSATMPVVNTPEVSASSPDEELQRLFRLYMEARNSDMIEEAEVLAKQLVELSIHSYGYESQQTAHALTDLGELQTSNGDYHSAILNLASAIGIIERIDNRLSISLVSPLRALGEAHLQSGSVDLAVFSWDRAVHVTHVNLGPHNYDQVETLISISRVLEQEERHKEANRMRRRIAHLAKRETDETFRPGYASTKKP